MKKKALSTSTIFESKDVNDQAEWDYIAGFENYQPVYGSQEGQDGGEQPDWILDRLSEFMEDRDEQMRPTGEEEGKFERRKNCSEHENLNLNQTYTLKAPSNAEIEKSLSSLSQNTSFQNLPTPDSPPPEPPSPAPIHNPPPAPSPSLSKPFTLPLTIPEIDKTCKKLIKETMKKKKENRKKLGRYRKYLNDLRSSQKTGVKNGKRLSCAKKKKPSLWKGNTSQSRNWNGGFRRNKVLGVTQEDSPKRSYMAKAAMTTPYKLPTSASSPKSLNSFYKLARNSMTESKGFKNLIRTGPINQKQILFDASNNRRSPSCGFKEETPLKNDFEWSLAKRGSSSIKKEPGRKLSQKVIRDTPPNILETPTPKIEYEITQKGSKRSYQKQRRRSQFLLISKTIGNSPQRFKHLQAKKSPKKNYLSTTFSTKRRFTYSSKNLKVRVPSHLQHHTTNYLFLSH
ncbi:unnamed protein product [Moneuplotes crassus]|uniref:Uncharacterized protein n=1 Tax=Euplotes crassus TaxID=5936 RepID=A0AAD1XTU3_EUPCR|nr:unnamed protein product [Moneuplotes crassus]